ncbi:MAG: hypothetical protein A4E67_02315 [Syntrophaceae bacterium PtaB.Bin038]|nr:MAG: hypothetical protein A4E67_02315 [Syntrophaceae bacterium PtaB.Bin038]
MGFGALQPALVIQVFPAVPRMGGQGLPRPVGEASVLVVSIVVEGEVDAQLSAHDELLQERLARRGGNGFLRGDPQGHGKGGDLPEVQVGAETGRIVEARVISPVRVVTKLPGDEVFQAGAGCGRAPAQRGDGSHRSVDLHGPGQRREILHDVGVEAEGQRVLPHRPLRERGHVPLEDPVQLGPQGARRVLLLRRGRFGGNDNVGLHLHDGAGGVGRDVVAPLPLDAQVAPVGHDEGRLAGQLQGRALGRAVQEREADTPQPQCVANPLDPLEHEGVVPQVGLGEPVRQSEGDNDGQLEGVGLADGVLEGVIALDPLGSLHPVQDVAAVLDAAAVQGLDARGVDHGRYSRKSISSRIASALRRRAFASAGASRSAFRY